MTRKKFSDVEIYYIQKNPENLTPKQLSLKFSTSENRIKTILNEVKKEEEEKPVEVKKPKTMLHALIGKKERNGKVVATVMTKAAAELGDSHRKNNDAKLNKNIFRPMGD